MGLSTVIQQESNTGSSVGYKLAVAGLAEMVSL